MADVIIAGLGPATEQYLTAEVRSLLESGDIPVYLRTGRHPAAKSFLTAEHVNTFDDVYESADTIEDVYKTIVEKLVAAAHQHGTVAYIVPGSPLIAESAVRQLREDERITTTVHPALSFLDLAWARLDVDPFAVSPRLVDGYTFATEAAGQRGPLLVGQCDDRMILSDIKLSFEDNEPESAVVLQNLGLPDENVQTVKWEDLDRSFEPNHLTSIWIPEVASPVGAELARLNEVAHRLRSECPWDQEQTHQSLTKYAIEETYELIEAIEARTADLEADETDLIDTDLIEELGDVLFQVFFHSAIAQQEGRFTIADVAANVADKLIGRHPHVYGDVHSADSQKVLTSNDVRKNWESNKLVEKGRTSVMEGIPNSLPALLYAQKVLKKAAGQGYELDEADLENTGPSGALLIMADHTRRQGVDAEAELRRATNAFRDRFEHRTD